VAHSANPSVGTSTSDTGYSIGDFKSDVETHGSGMGRLVVRCIATFGSAVLLCRRAHEPRSGRWTIPGGFHEPGESLTAAAEREVLEETGAVARGLKLLSVHDLPQLGQLVFTFSAVLAGSAVLVGDEQLESRFFESETIPWTELAFPTDQITLQTHFANSSEPLAHVVVAEITWDACGRILVRGL
jgi:ADP-ribose pyrophosphatase YjhB (NUDIX family)